MFAFVCENQRSVFICCTKDIYGYFDLIKSKDFQLNIGNIRTSEINAHCDSSGVQKVLEQYGVSKHYCFPFGDCYRLKNRK